MAERTGLEIVGYILSPVAWMKSQCLGYWDRYLALVGVAEENTRLRADLRRARAATLLAAEDQAELQRLRGLLRLDALYEHPGFAARVVARRFGPLATMDTFIVDKGYLDGAVSGTPVVTEYGVVGRVLRAAPHAAIVQTFSDPGFRLAVVSQSTRTPGIVSGAGGDSHHLIVNYISQTALITPGDLLITAGEDRRFPKGLPVGVVTRVRPGNETLFQQVWAQPLIDLQRLEEVILLQPKKSGPPLLKREPEATQADPDMPDSVPALQLNTEQQNALP